MEVTRPLLAAVGFFKTKIKVSAVFSTLSNLSLIQNPDTPEKRVGRESDPGGRLRRWPGLELTDILLMFRLILSYRGN